ncbi:MAG: hypothetical protein IJ086_15280 [Clostridium sp.]|nr:hypothetical protein [Clostridium sp.]MBQ9000038.1 hypothetical protein [Clostridium sp.]
MNKKGYREKRNLYSEKYYDYIQKSICNIEYSQITHRFLTDTDEILELMNNIFDEWFWQDMLSKNAIERSLKNKESFILFEIENMPCALALVSDSNDNSERELYQLDIEDYLFERGNGLGEKIVNILREHIYPTDNIYGYSVSEAAKFWARISTNYDPDVFNSMRKEHLENGGEENELFESEGLMYFSL